MFHIYRTGNRGWFFYTAENSHSRTKPLKIYTLRCTSAPKFAHRSAFGVLLVSWSFTSDCHILPPEFTRITKVVSPTPVSISMATCYLWLRWLRSVWLNEIPEHDLPAIWRGGNWVAMVLAVSISDRGGVFLLAGLRWGSSVTWNGSPLFRDVSRNGLFLVLFRWFDGRLEA